MDRVVNTLETKGVSSDKLTQINNRSQTCNHTKFMDKVLLDNELEKRGHKFVRYADDANIYVASERAGKRG